MSKQETEGSSQREKLNLSALLQMKKCERPAPEFWEKFDRQLKQRQLQALVKPTWQERFFQVNSRVGAWLAPAAVACVAFVLAWNVFIGSDAPLARQIQAVAPVSESRAVAYTYAEKPEKAYPASEPVADQSPDEGSELPIEEERIADASFVFDAIDPDSRREAMESFRTFAHPETFHANREPTAQYIVNAYESSSSSRIEMDSRPTRFRVYSDLYESGPSTRLEGGVSMEF